MSALQYYCRRCDRWMPLAHTHGKATRNVSRRKARLILHHGEVRGYALTEKQRRFFGARASGYPYRRNGIAGSLWKGAKAGYHHYRAGRLEEAAKRHRAKATFNPRTIPGRALEIRYLRSDGKRYFHPFEHNVKMIANRDGSVTLRGSKRIHADDREPGFWKRYGHGRHRKMTNPRRRRRRSTGASPNWLLIGGVGLLVYAMMNRNQVGAVSTGGQMIVGQGAGTIWYADPYQGGDAAFFTGPLPPGASPPWRIASATEVAAREMGLLAGSYVDAGGGLVAPNPGFLT